MNLQPNPVDFVGHERRPRRVMKRAIVAVARKLAIVLHRMWRDEAGFRWSKAA
jgi:transposase